MTLTYEELIPYFKFVMNRVTWEENGCWNYHGHINPRGYPVMKLGIMHGRKSMYVHRLIYEFYFGEIPFGMTIDHTCRNIICCHPEHLECVTRQENSRRMATAQVPRESCVRGHKYTEENTIRYPNAEGRVCRKCKAIHQRTSYLKRREKSGV